MRLALPGRRSLGDQLGRTHATCATLGSAVDVAERRQRESAAWKLTEGGTPNNTSEDSAFVILGGPKARRRHGACIDDSRCLPQSSMVQAMADTKMSYGKFSSWLARQSGRPLATGLAMLTIVVWAVTGPVFGYSDTWQLVINTGTTIITFLMVFVIQNSQMRDTQALQSKLDELIRANQSAENAMIDLEDLDDEEVARIHERYCKIAQAARKHGIEGD